MRGMVDALGQDGYRTKRDSSSKPVRRKSVPHSADSVRNHGLGIGCNRDNIVMEQGEKYRAGPSDFLAVERTFLAWVRTGLALMALGFVLARFGFFLQEFSVMRPDAHIASYGYSLWFGTTLILLGVLVSVLSLVRYLDWLAI